MCSATQLKNAGTRTPRQDCQPRAFWSAYLLSLAFSQPTRQLSAPDRWRFRLFSHHHHPISIWQRATTVTRQWAALRPVTERSPTANRVCNWCSHFHLFSFACLLFSCVFLCVTCFCCEGRDSLPMVPDKTTLRMPSSRYGLYWSSSTHQPKRVGGWKTFVLSLCETLKPLKMYSSLHVGSLYFCFMFLIFSNWKTV